MLACDRISTGRVIHTSQNTAVQCRAFAMPANRALTMEKVPPNGERTAKMVTAMQSPTVRNEMERIIFPVLNRWPPFKYCRPRLKISASDPYIPTRPSTVGTAYTILTVSKVGASATMRAAPNPDTKHVYLIYGGSSSDRWAQGAVRLRAMSANPTTGCRMYVSMLDESGHSREILL